MKLLTGKMDLLKVYTGQKKLKTTNVKDSYVFVEKGQCKQEWVLRELQLYWCYMLNDRYMLRFYQIIFKKKGTNYYSQIILFSLPPCSPTYIVNFTKQEKLKFKFNIPRNYQVKYFMILLHIN